MDDGRATRDVDIAGTMAQPMDGWQERVNRLAKPELWQIDVFPDPALWEALTPSQRERTLPKIELVRKAAALMMAGMMKGTLKYETDEWTLERWIAHVVGEGIDQQNYNILMLDRFTKDKQAALADQERVKKAWESEK